METKTARIFLNSAGALLLMAATALVIGNRRPGYLQVQEPHDAVLMVFMSAWCWAVAGILFVVGLICLFGRQGGLRAASVAWVATSAGVWWLGLVWTGGGRLDAFCELPGRVWCFGGGGERGRIGVGHS